MRTLSDSTVVIYRLGSLGDTIVALPCFNAIAKRFPTSRRVVLTNFPISAKAAPLLSVLGSEGAIVHGVLAYPVGTRSLGELIRLREKLRALKSDRIIYLMPHRSRAAAWRDWLFFKLCGFRHIMGFPYTDDLRENRVDPVSGIEEPEAERLARCCADIGAVDLHSRAAWDLHLSDAERSAGHAVAAPLLGGRYLALNMGGKAVEKDWGLDNWLALFRDLAGDYPDYGLLVVGADVDSDRAEAFLASWPGPKVNGCGKLSPRESAAAMERAALFIGHDSGPLHLAAAAGAPCLGLFGDFNRPNKWHPIGKDVSVIHNMQGMAAISVAEVAAAVRARLGAPAIAAASAPQAVAGSVASL